MLFEATLKSGQLQLYQTFLSEQIQHKVKNMKTIWKQNLNKISFPSHVVIFSWYLNWIYKYMKTDDLKSFQKEKKQTKHTLLWLFCQPQTNLTEFVALLLLFHCSSFVSYVVNASNKLQSWSVQTVCYASFKVGNTCLHIWGGHVI